MSSFVGQCFAGRHSLHRAIVSRLQRTGIRCRHISPGSIARPPTVFVSYMASDYSSYVSQVLQLRKRLIESGSSPEQAEAQLEACLPVDYPVVISAEVKAILDKISAMEEKLDVKFSAMEEKFDFKLSVMIQYEVKLQRFCVAFLALVEALICVAIGARSETAIWRFITSVLAFLKA